MQKVNQKMILSFLCSRHIATSSGTCQKMKGVSMNKQVNMMKKIMSGREKGKRRWVYNESMPKTESATQITNPKGQNKQAAKRVVVLNKLFMKNVSDMMATDTFAKDILGYGVQITNVKMAEDYKSVNVYWLARSDDKDAKVQKILDSISFPLRHELSQLRLMGEVPRIYFVRDREYSKAAEIDAILKNVDFGDDFVPTDPTLFMKTEPEIYMKLSEEIKQRLQEAEKSFEESSEAVENEPEIPEMKHDVFGVDHEKIMRKISVNIGKSRAAWENFHSKQASGEVKIPAVRDLSEIAKVTGKLQAEAAAREEFSKYLQRKQFDKKSNGRNKNLNLNPEIDDDQNDLYKHEDLYEDDYYIEEDFHHHDERK